MSQRRYWRLRAPRAADDSSSNLHHPSCLGRRRRFTVCAAFGGPRQPPEAFASDYASTAAQGGEVWAQRIADNIVDEGGVIYVAAVEEQLIGTARIGRGDRPKTRHTATIAGVYVRPEWRNRRVAEALLDACIGWGRAHGVVIFKLAVVTTNAAAIRCYTRCGFAVYGVEPKAIRHDGVFYDELLMSRSI